MMSFAKALCFTVVATMSTSALAIPLTWTLTNVTFDDGASATGSFVYDADTNVLSNWAISTAAGGLPWNHDAKTYTTSDSYLLAVPTNGFGPGGTQFWAVLESSVYFHPINPLLASNFRIGTTAALTNAGGIVGLDLNNYAGECYECSRARLFQSGTLVASTTDTGSGSVPEPSVIALMGLGLFGLGFARRHA